MFFALILGLSQPVQEQFKAWSALTGLPAVVEAQKPLKRFSGYVSTWSQDCAPSCGLPRALDKNLPVKLELDSDVKPGEASAAKRHLTTAELDVELSLYAVRPKDGAPVYYQAQVDVKGGAEAFCGATLSEADAAPFPVLLCAGKPDASGRRYGVTLHRFPL